jgi:DNA-directed RNA polymerase subunit N (RpoN/RPB10)
MYNMLRCPSCGNSIGEFDKIFNLLRMVLIEEELGKIDGNIVYNQVQNNNTINLDLSEVFDLLHIDKYCCRSKMTTVINFNAQLYKNVY